jgi:alpha-L-fucosidase
MRLRRWTAAAVALAAASLTGTGGAVATAGDDAPTAPTRVEARRRLEDARFGLLIDWGVHTLLGKGPAVMERDRLPVREYEKLPPRFNPTELDPAAWVKAARDAGARSLAVTVKGPDGFCLFDTALTRYDIVDATPFARDPLKPLADACQKHGLPLVVVYSLTDWHHPDAPTGAKGSEAKGDRDPGGYREYVRGQLVELCTRYGPLGGVWLDVSGARDRPKIGPDLAGFVREVRERQPAALVGVRMLAPGEGTGEDVDVRFDDLADPAMLDRVAPAVGDAEGDGGPLVEVVSPLSARPAGSDAESGRQRLAAEVRDLAAAAGRGANLRLRVTARADGAIAPEAVETLAALGRWLETSGASIQGTRRGPIAPQGWGVSTRKVGAGGAAMVYLHVFHPEEPLILPGASVSLAARRLGGTSPLPMTRADGRAVVTIPEAERDPVDTIIVLSPEVLDPQRRGVRR